MNMKILVSSLILAAISGVSAEKYVRSNLVGYAPSAPKRIVVMADEDCSGQSWGIKNAAGAQVASGVIGKSLCGKTAHTPKAFNHEFRFDTVRTEGTYTVEIKGVAPFTVTVKKDPYQGALESVLHWLRVTRSGTRDVVDHEPSHFGDSSCVIFRRACDDDSSCNEQWVEDTANPKRVNMLGGRYDAGDYLKFTHTIAYATYMQLRAYAAYPSIFTKKLSTSEYVDVLDEAKFGLDYLLKTMPDNDTNEFIIQVGGNEDHNVGIRLPHEDEFDGKRPALSALSQPQMALTAATLALGAQTFGTLGKKDLADVYAAKAALIYRRALSSDVVKIPACMVADGSVFYLDPQSADNLELAAAELYRLTGSASYLADAKKFAEKAGTAGWVAWGDLNIFSHLRLMDKDPVAKKYLVEDLDGFLAYSKQKGNIWSLPMDYGWACLYSFIEASSASMDYEMVTGDRKYHAMAANVTDYLFGLNNWGLSFVALKGINSIEHPYSQIYRMQCQKFPEGAISEGPSDRPTNKENSAWFGFDQSCERTYPFNTEQAVFFDNVEDYVSMETIISGVSDGLYMIAVLSALVAK